MKRSFSYAVAVAGAALLLTGAGCISIKTGGSAAQQDGSFYKSADHGATWERKVARPTAEGVASITAANITSIVQHPAYAPFLYAGTNGSGLLYSLDRAETWHQAAGVGSVITDIALHALDKCTSFVASENKLYRSNDCSITYQAMYVDPRAKALVKSVVADVRDPRVVLMGNSMGDVLRSADEGASWSPVAHFDNAIVKIVVSPQDSRTLWVLTTRGLQLSTDGGNSWKDMSRTLDDYDGARTGATDLLHDPVAPGTLVLVSAAGVLRTTDGGNSWQPVNTLTAPEDTTVTAFAINPKNNKDMYYTSAATLYYTADGGTTWVTRRVPAPRVGTALAVDAEQGTVYLGLSKSK